MTDLSGERMPSLERETFYCPLCGAFAHQNWFGVRGVSSAGRVELDEYDVSICRACVKPVMWRNGSLLYPAIKVDVRPHEDMPANVLSVYEEARAVSGASRKSAAALIRLALQTLVDDLEPGAGNVNAKIGRLVAKGLDPQVQQAMDVLRVVGNNAVHPGQIDLDGDESLVPSLFTLANLVVEQMIARPKRVQSLYDALPEHARQQIERRDAPAG